MNINKFLSDDKDNKSVTRLVFLISAIIIFIYIITTFFIEMNIFHIQILYALIGWNLALIGFKNWKDKIIK